MSAEELFSTPPDGTLYFGVPKVELSEQQLLERSISGDRNGSSDGSNSNAVSKRGKRKGDGSTRSNKRHKEEQTPKQVHQPAGHRPVTSCTHCRQHKIKCNASERFPKPCSRCERMDLKCEIDPEFRPKKGSQIQSLRNDVDELRSKIALLTKNEGLIAQALQTPTTTAVKQEEKPLVTKQDLPPLPAHVVTSVNTTPLLQPTVPIDTAVKEFCLGDVKISLEKASELHERFVQHYLPYLPIMETNDPIELYHQSQLLFWTVMLTGCLSDPEPTLYISLAALIKQLAIETCWIRTPRSTHIVQALLILGTWPLPNQKVLDDCSYRFIGLAKSLSLQLGLHRGKFIQEFSRTQVELQDAEKWRTRSWLAVFFSEQFWSSNLGLPPSLQTDYLLEQARVDQNLPKNFRCLLCLAIFQSKLVNVMGLSVTSPDGLMEPRNRAGALLILERELERLAYKLQIDDIVVEIYYLYVKLMVCLFAFLPETPSEDQTKYVTIGYIAATRIVTLMSQLLESRQLTEYPIYVRQAVTTAAFVLFRLHLTPYLLPKYIDSARQSVVTVHRLFRNMLAAWKDVENDISRTATVLEKLNFAMITHPELFTEEEGIIVRMRSHLTGSLFYDLVWDIHEARRRFIEDQKDGKERPQYGLQKGRPLPLPFYNQITKDDFKAITTTTPDGTTVTTLVPTDQAINNAKASTGQSKLKQINGIPLAMLEATGSLPATKESSPEKKKRGRRKGKQQKQKQSTPAAPEQIFTASSSIPSPMAHTSMSAGVNGMVPPPLFPNTSQGAGYERPIIPGPQASTTMGNNGSSSSNTPTHTPSEDGINDQFINSIFQQQGGGWTDNTGDDLLGWLDINMAPEF